MDAIFENTNSVFSVVSVARELPRRYGKNGELLINYAEEVQQRVEGEKAAFKTDSSSGSEQIV